MRKLVLLMLCLASSAHALTWQEETRIAALFEEAGIAGTFVVFDPQAQILTGFDQARATTRFIPASTFKIPNSLIGLETGAVRDLDEVLPYGGGRQFLPEWEQDMSLREAIVISNVPVYKTLARRIGLERMQQQVSQLAFGNAQVGTQVDNFWLQGPLEISAVEQVLFLEKLTRDALPASPAAQAAVRDIVRLEQGDGWTLYGKTGWAMDQEPEVAWWVGWVQRGDRMYSFALNMTVQDASDGSQRLPLGKAALALLGILPAR